MHLISWLFSLPNKTQRFVLSLSRLFAVLLFITAQRASHDCSLTAILRRRHCQSVLGLGIGNKSQRDLSANLRLSELVASRRGCCLRTTFLCFTWNSFSLLTLSSFAQHFFSSLAVLLAELSSSEDCDDSVVNSVFLSLFDW